jgi:thymidylate kinase
MRLLLAYVRAILNGAPGLVVLVGPDGSGKSTLAPLLAAALETTSYPMQKAPLLWREVNPGLLSFNAGLRRRMLGRRPGPVRKLLAALTHPLEYLERHLRLARILGAHGGRVVTDGYSWGPVIRWRRRSSRVPFWATMAAASAFPTPGLVVLCGGDPDAINVRKADMTPQEIRATVRRYRALFRGLGVHVMEVDTTRETVDASVERVWRVLAAGRPGGPSPRPAPLDSRAPG